ncbi:uncharacterized protein LOC127836338 [Dreissena polymorpha]|uniref:uncharacterized protein LOC127836338 n=1 Tax=Dreissena polymorpha TaxID=45954 RepID=UPI002264E6D7|nr:uncharacterized protein LOC127836338 [Dreissena polymorpha]
MSAVKFTTGVPQQSESLDLEWTINPMCEPGFLYARKRRSAEDFRANGGIRVRQGASYTTKLPILLEPGVSIIFELIPHVDDALALNIKKTGDDVVMHFVCRGQLDTLFITSKVNGDFIRTDSMDWCIFVNDVSQTLMFEIQTDMDIMLSLDGRVLTTYDSAIDPRVARSLNVYVSGPEDFTLNRIEFIKM